MKRCTLDLILGLTFSGQMLFFTLSVFGYTWPVDPPFTYRGTSSKQHEISTSFLAYRPAQGSLPRRFHAGVDIAEPVNTLLYSVLPGKVIGVGSDWIEIRHDVYEFGITYYIFKYRHEYAPTVSIGDTIYDCFDCVGPPPPGVLYRHLSIGKINAENHLHFEQWAPFGSSEFTGINALESVTNQHYLDPFCDQKPARFRTSPYAFMVFRDADGLIFDQNQDGNPDGVGTESDPYLVNQAFDIEVHAIDDIPTDKDCDGVVDAGEVTWTSNIYKADYRVLALYGAERKSLYTAFEFHISSKVSSENREKSIISDGTDFIFTYASIFGNPYYWVTNYYDNTAFYDGGKDADAQGTVYPEYLLALGEKARIEVGLHDLTNSRVSAEFWIKYINCIAKAGDATGDGNINLQDIVYIVNYVFNGGPAPSPYCRGDATGNGVVDLVDINYLVNYVFKAGPAPVNSDVCCL